MRSPRLRRAIAVVAFGVATAILPLSNLNAATRHESRWDRPEPAVQRLVRQATTSLWNVLVGIWETTGLRIDGNG